MVRGKEKGQGLTEFALILPILLLLLLGIIEAGRIIWAYVTVQAAAREAARYAITGKPYVLPKDIDAKNDPNPDVYPGGSPCRTITGEETNKAFDPWLCNPDIRVDAIKQVAAQRGQTLMVSTICDEPDTFDGSSACAQTPGAFGVQVLGQVISPTVSLTQPVGIVDYAGTPGLNVQILTFYNVTMLDPIYDALLGGRFIRVNSRVEMQNEGVDRSMDVKPPPAINNGPIINPGEDNNPTGPNDEQIWALNGYTKKQGEELLVHLEKHAPLGPDGSPVTYDVYVENLTSGRFRICSGVQPNSQGAADVPCTIDFTIPPGVYDLYSTIHDHLEKAAPGAPEKVTVEASITPLVRLRDPITKKIGNVWAAGSNVEVLLISHQTADQPFSVDLRAPSDTQIASIATGVSVDGTNIKVISWTVPNTGECPPGGGSACTVQSHEASPSGPYYAKTELYINQPEIVLNGNNMVYAQGETMYIYLRGHTPNTAYRVRIADMATNEVKYEQTADVTDAEGNTTTPLVVPIPEGALGWDDGMYKISSHPVDDPLAQVALLENVQILTPPGPYITVEGGYVWPVDSFINIKVHKHQPDARHYLTFGDWRVPTTSSGPPNTFKTDAVDGVAVVPYQIPITATKDVTKTFTIASFIDEKAGPYNSGEKIATRDVEVFPVPVIQVLEGKTALPDARITIRLTSHAPNTSYAVFYAGTRLFNIVTDGKGEAQRVYDLSFLNSGPQPGCTICYGVSYEMYSQQNIGAQAKVASTQFLIRPADLQITKVDLPLKVTINTTIPVTLTIRNLEPVTISRYFDIDYYLDPAPLIPSYQAGRFNFPGDVKTWQNSVAPGGTFTKKENFFIGEYGTHSIYGYADTSNFIYGEPSEVNNVLSNTFTVQCLPSLVTETFQSEPLGWTETPFGDGAGSHQVSSGQLVLNSQGTSTLGSNDNDSNMGLFYYHKTNPVSTTTGLDVRVQLLPGGSKLNPGSRYGLSLRDSKDDGKSAKIDFGLVWLNNRNKEYLVQVDYRRYGQFVTERKDEVSGAKVTLSGSESVWLRIRRQPDSNTFEFYYLKKSGSTAPTDAEWNAVQAYDSFSLDLKSALYAGLFNASFKKGNTDSARFDNFAISLPESCQPAQGQPGGAQPPPGLRICSTPLVNGTFESATNFAWQTDPLTFALQGKGGFNASTRGLQASTYYTSYNVPGPYFAQSFAMPTWVMSNTTAFTVNLSKWVKQIKGSDPNDVFYVAVYSGNPIASSNAITLTVPISFANGTDAATWVRMDNLKLPVAPGVNLENYAGKTLYIYFYNFSNTGCQSFDDPPAGCHNTTYIFDDVDLTICTNQPLPDGIKTRIQGNLTLSFLNGSSQKIAGVKVWAYAEGGKLYETFTIQDGEFNFLNLPATPEGTKYFIYAEYNVINPLNPNSVETLADYKTVILKTNNSGTSPVTTRLILQTLY